MAGMLPGVECARRRRFRQGGTMELQSGTRRSSFCLYRSNSHESTFTSSFARSSFNKSSPSRGLAGVAREARERLDERLRAQMSRHNGTGSFRPLRQEGNGGEKSSAVLLNLPRAVFCSKKNSRRRFSWSRLGWKAAEQGVCAVCLEEFKNGDILLHLPCAHRFHCQCISPWLQQNAHCPCCRTVIPSLPAFVRREDNEASF